MNIGTDETELERAELDSAFEETETELERAELDSAFEETETELETTGSATRSEVDVGLRLDALCRHREILRRETNFLRGEVKSRGFATLAGKMAYMESRSGETVSLPPSLVAPELFAAVGVSFPHLVANPQESLDLLLQESHHLCYRIQSLASIVRKFANPSPNEKFDNPSPKGMFLMSRTAVMMAATMKSHVSISSGSLHETSSESLHRLHWESIWGSGKESNGVFDDITTLSPMQFTPSTPGIVPCSATICPALQIYSIKIVELNVHLNWPLYVYGVIAARDTVDRNRNLLFYQSRANCQLVTRDDPFLCLTGPSRAIVAANPVTFEVELKIKCPGADRALLFCTYNWCDMQDTTPWFRGYPCAAELSLEHLPRAIQATIVSVGLKGSWPPKHGYRVYCSLSAAQDPTPREVELLNCSCLDCVEKCHIGADGYLGLARNVVSAQLGSTLKVVIQAKARYGGRHNYVEFPVQYCQTSRASCHVVGCEVEVVVAWSLLVEDKQDLML
ncbi:hypothetical protein ACQ4PT_049215 [Festuca glaucescens]